MSSRDYSRYGEQEHILKFFHRHTGRLRFLDIGAGDGITGSNTRALSELGWHGCCIEAAPRAFDRCVENRAGHSIEYVHAAVGPEPGLVQFYDTEPRDGFDSVDTGRYSTTSKERPSSLHAHRCYRVAQITPMDIAVTVGTIWHFVSIDIEGTELSVLPLMGPLLEDTLLLCFEDTVPGLPFDKAHYDRMIEAVAKFGFQYVVARTFYADADGKNHPVNTLVTK